VTQRMCAERKESQCYLKEIVVDSLFEFMFSSLYLDICPNGRKSACVLWCHWMITECFFTVDLNAFLLYFERLMGVHIFVFLCPSVSFVDYCTAIDVV